MFQSLIQNPWVVGFTASVLGGLVATGIWAYLSKRKNAREQSREHLLIVNHANEGLLNAVRKRISEPNPTLNRDFVDSLINATAIRHRIRAADLFSIVEIADEMTRYVSGLPFVSAQRKQRILDQLAELKTQELEQQRFSAQGQVPGQNRP